jgi:hypothetical protein
VLHRPDMSVWCWVFGDRVATCTPGRAQFDIVSEAAR